MTREDVYQPLHQAITKYLSNAEHLDFIRRAFDFSYDKHAARCASPANPIIVHPVQSR